MSRALEKQPGEETDEKKRIPRWLPLSLLTVTTIALTVPAVLLWRQKRALSRNNSLRATAPPGRRRRGISWQASAGSSKAEVGADATSMPAAHLQSKHPPPRRAGASSKNSLSIRKPLASTEKPNTTNASQISSEDTVSLFDGPLMSLGALGLATGAVGIAAAIGVWGIQRSLGIDNVNDFAVRVRQLIRTHMPGLSSRLYRPADDSDGIIPLSAEEQGIPSTQVKANGWTWDAAEDRLRAAFDRGGVGEWAESAMRELEAEEELERRRRGL